MLSEIEKRVAAQVGVSEAAFERSKNALGAEASEKARAGEADARRILGLAPEQPAAAPAPKKKKEAARPDKTPTGPRAVAPANDGDDLSKLSDEEIREQILKLQEELDRREAEKGKPTEAALRAASVRQAKLRARMASNKAQIATIEAEAWKREVKKRAAP